MKFYRFAFLSLFIPSVAAAHIGVPSGPAFATLANKVTFGISHGCHFGSAPEQEMDTLSIKIDIPANAGINRKSVRALPSDFGGKPTVTHDSEGVTSITWSRTPADMQPIDHLGYYEISFRATFGDVPFTRIPFTITQVCLPPNGTIGVDDLTVVWTGPSTNASPSPRLTVLPKREYGWNKLTLTTAVAVGDFGTYFGDALIVWKGTAAFSKNMAINALIGMTPGVTLLNTDLAAGDEIWVRY